MDKWCLEVRLFNERGEEHVRRVELDRDSISSGMSPRLRGDMEIGALAGLPVPGVGFTDVVEMMKKREFRRELMVSEVKRLMSSICDHMEDAEGWHGLDRAEKAGTR